jgi:hypothetical protein
MKKNKKYYPNIRPEMRNGQWMYWQQISPDNGWVFKFDYIFAGLVPPFLGMFVDAIDIDTFKQLQKDKAFLDVYKIIMGTVPRHKDNKTNNQKDDFAIDANTLSSFIQLVKTGLPSQVDFKAVPLENLTSFDFENSTTEKNISGTAIKNFYRNSGAESSMFGADRPNASTVKASTRTDQAFVEQVYSQFQMFLNYQLNKVTKKYKFSVKLSGTIFDEQDRFDNQMSLLSNGIITPELPSALHMTERELRNGLSMMVSLGYPDMFKPVQTSSTLSDKNNAGGRPQKKEVKESGEITRDEGSNEE